MKFKLFTAAAVALMLFSCKNESTTDTKTKGDTTKTVTAAPAGTENEGAVETTPATAAAIEDGKVLLRLNYPKGFKQELTYTTDIELAGMMDNTSTMLLNLKVVSVTKDSDPLFGIQATINSMKVNGTAMGQKLAYDSSQDVAKMGEKEKTMDKKFKSVAGQPINVFFDNKGNVVGKMELKNKEGELQEQPFDPRIFQVSFPEEPVSVGESWSSQADVATLGGKVKNTYTLKSVSAEEVVLSLVTIVPKVAGLEKETKFTGDYILDAKTGMLKKGGIKGKVNQGGMVASINMSFTGRQIN